MADIQPLRAIHYELARTDGLQPVVAPPYDVIHPAERASLAARSPYNVVRIDLPTGEDPYGEAARLFARWKREGVLVRDPSPALWPLEQDYTGPDGRRRTRRGFFARVRVEGYGPGRIRPHERTHPGPKEDRLRLTRATQANLSPIFSLFADPEGRAWRGLEEARPSEPWGRCEDADGTVNRLWRVDDPVAIEAAREVLADAELLIADGHHRYETARVYAEEVGGEGDQRYVLMCLVALQDPGLTVFPTHRLLRGLGSEKQEALAQAIRRDFRIEEVGELAELVPPPGEPVTLGYIDAHFQRPLRLRLKDPEAADAALAGHGPAYRRLDTAVLEALILRGALGMTGEDIDHRRGLGYARSFDEALNLVRLAEYDAAFFMSPPPIGQVQEIAAEGESMPPKSTYFYPKVPTGLLFNPLSGRE